MFLFLICCLLCNTANTSIKASVDRVDSGSFFVSFVIENNSSKTVYLPGIDIYQGRIISYNWDLIIKKDGESVYLNNPLFKIGKLHRLSIPPHSSHSFLISIELSRLIYSFGKEVGDIHGNYQVQIVCKLSPRKGALISNVVQIEL